MDDAPSALVELATSVERSIGDGALETERGVQLRAVEPLVEVLGWNLRDGDVVPETTIGGVVVDYVLAIDERPVVAIATTAPDDPIEQPLDRLESAITQSDVERGIATDGRTLTLLAIAGGELHSRAFPLADLADNTTALERYHRAILASQSPTPEQRREARHRIAANRDALAERIADDIVAVSGEHVEPTVIEASERTVDSLLDTLEPIDESDETTVEPSHGERSPDASASRASTPQSSASATTSDGSDSQGDRVPPQADDRAETASAESPNVQDDPSTDATTGEPSTTEADASYVARFFGGSSSVGAVGTDSPAGTTIGVVRYLLENHDLATSITLPWQEPGGRTVIDGAPGGEGWAELRRADGEQLYVRPIDDPTVARNAIEALAEQAGLRVMFQGDW